MEENFLELQECKPYGFFCPKTNGKYDPDEMDRFYADDPNIKFKEFKIDHDDIDTKETNCDFSKIIKDVTFSQIYAEIKNKSRKFKIWWKSKKQINAVVLANSTHFVKDNRCYLFFYKNSKGRKLVFLVFFFVPSNKDERWYLKVYDFKHNCVFGSKYNHEVVYPK